MTLIRSSKFVYSCHEKSIISRISDGMKMAWDENVMCKRVVDKVMDFG